MSAQLPTSVRDGFRRFDLDSDVRCLDVSACSLVVLYVVKGSLDDLQ